MSNCKTCFKELDSQIFINDIFNIKEHTLCYTCFQKMELVQKDIEFGDYKIFVLITYNSFIKELIYKFKGLYDIELSTIFLEYFIDEINEKYRGYSIAFAPSFMQEDKKRGYNHVQEIFKGFKGNKILCFSKSKNIKQSDQDYSDRENIKNVITINYNMLRNIKKLLIVDDIATSGNTLISCYNLAQKAGVKNIKLLALCVVKSKIIAKNKE